MSHHEWCTLYAPTVRLESRANFTVNVLPCVALVTGIDVQGYLRMGKPAIATPKTLYPEAPLPKITTGTCIITGSRWSV